MAAIIRSSLGAALRRVRMILCALVLTVLIGVSPLAIPEPLSLNFRDTDIRHIIESVGELTGKNFLIDSRVRGKVTIIANEPVPEEALYDVMLAILRMNGFRAVETEHLTRILPGNVAQRFKPPFLETPPAGESEKLVTTIIPIRHLNAASILPIIKPLMTSEAQTVLHKETNNLLITEINTNLERVMRIISKIDVADVGDFEIVALDYAEAKDVVALVQRASNKSMRHLVQVVADKEANRIILTGPRRMRVGLRALIAELDSETRSDTSGRLKVIRLHYARAEDIEKIVKGLLSSSEFIKTLAGYDDDIDVSQPEVSKEKTGQAKAKDKAKDKDKDKDKAKASKSDSSKISSKRNYVIEVDKALNALIVGGPEKVIEAIERVVREIDVPRPQVLIEAIFADVTETRAFSLNSRLTGGKPGDGLNGTIITDGDGGIRQFLGTVFSSDNLSAGGQISIDGNVINLLIRALRADTDSRILSTPAILTLNNEEASIDVSEVISVRTGTVITESGRTVEDIERQEFGTELKVTPQITEGDAVRLDISYKTEELGARAQSGDARREPDSKKREIETTVLVDDGDILVLGGLSNESATESENRAPLLSRVPVLGHLFRDRSSNRNKTTLMVFIRPTILRNAEAGGAESRTRYAELRLKQLVDVQSIETLLQEEDPIVLPELPFVRDSAGSRDDRLIKSDINTGERRKLKRKKRVIKRRRVRREGDS